MRNYEEGHVTQLKAGYVLALGTAFFLWSCFIFFRLLAWHLEFLGRLWINIGKRWMDLESNEPGNESWIHHYRMLNCYSVKRRSLSIFGATVLQTGAVQVSHFMHAAHISYAITNKSNNNNSIKKKINNLYNGRKTQMRQLIWENIHQGERYSFSGGNCLKCFVGLCWDFSAQSTQWGSCRARSIYLTTLTGQA